MRTLVGIGWVHRGLAVTLALVVVLMVLGWLASVHPLLEATTNGRAQLALVAFLVAGGLGLVQNWRLGGLAVVVTLLLSWPLVGYLTASPDPILTGTSTATVMQYNIYFGNTDYPGIAGHIQATDATVVALHELLPEQWEELEPLLDEYPYRIVEPLAEADGQPGGGMALLSKQPLERLPVDSAISPPDRVTIAAITTIDGRDVLVVGLHPQASRSDQAKVELRQRQLDGVAALVRSSDLPAIVLTDLNIAPTSPAYDDFLDDLGWRDPHHLVGWQASWPTWAGPLGMPIDHVFVSDDIALHDSRTGDGAGSDHRSVTAIISIRAVETESSMSRHQE